MHLDVNAVLKIDMSASKCSAFEQAPIKEKKITNQEKRKKGVMGGSRIGFLGGADEIVEVVEEGPLGGIGTGGDLYLLDLEFSALKS